MTTKADAKVFDRQIYSSLIISILVTLFLFFIDEGYYNFYWMTQVFNWIPFFIYVVLIFLPQIILIMIFNKIGNGRFTRYAQYVIGVVIGIACAFLVFS